MNDNFMGDIMGDEVKNNAPQNNAPQNNTPQDNIEQESLNADYHHIPNDNEPPPHFDIPTEAYMDEGQPFMGGDIQHNEIEFEPQEPIKEKQEPAQEPAYQYTLAELAELSQSDQDLTFEQIKLFREIKSLTDIQATAHIEDMLNSGRLKRGDSELTNAEMAMAATDLSLKTAKQFMSSSLEKLNESIAADIKKAKADIPYLQEDKAIISDLLRYQSEPDALGNKVIQTAREVNNDFLIARYKANEGKPISSGLLSMTQQNVLKEATGEQINSNSLVSRNTLKEVVRTDLELSANHKDYTALIKSAIGNKDYMNGLTQLIRDEYKSSDQSMTEKVFFEQKIAEFKSHSDLKDDKNIQLEVQEDIKKNKHYNAVKLGFDSNNKMIKDNFNHFRAEANERISTILNGKSPEFKTVAERQAKKEQHEQEEAKNAPQQAQNFNRCGSYPLSSLAYLLDKHFGRNAPPMSERIKSNFQDLTSWTKARKEEIKNNEKVQKVVDRVKDVSKDAAQSVTGKLQSQYVNPAKDYYYKRQPIIEAEQSLYKFVKNSDGTKVPNLDNSAAGQEMAKMYPYLKAIAELDLSKKGMDVKGMKVTYPNKDFALEKLLQFQSTFNKILEHNAKTFENANFDTYQKQNFNRDTLRSAGATLIDYQLTIRQQSNDLSKDEYLKLHAKTLSMANKLTTPLGTPKNEMESAAHRLYKNSVMLQVYANDYAFRKQKGMDTKNAEERMANFIEDIRADKKTLQTMAKDNLSNQFEKSEESKISAGKISTYVDLAKEAQSRAESSMPNLDSVKNPKAKPKDLHKEDEVEMANMMKNLQEFISNLFKKVSSLQLSSR